MRTMDIPSGKLTVCYSKWLIYLLKGTIFYSYDGGQWCFDGISATRMNVLWEHQEKHVDMLVEMYKDPQ